uniref:Carboxypeptidase n=1 Tax=Riptortus pedestris TaxID=329032 RepID=R4WI98_RIPPE|nr:retinoid-inducible serine carboxypeptidase [Riptortus pedestris]
MISAIKFSVFIYFTNLISFSISLKILPPKSELGEPLFLTPYIENGEIEKAQLAAFVNPIVGDLSSYAGFITVNKSCSSNLFFWYFPAEEFPETAPLVVWLQGGQGASSMYGLFEENGPLYFEKDGTLKTRQHYWSKVLNMIYIDNPVGTGYSFTPYDDCYARDEERIGKELFAFLVQFLELFPHLEGNELFISGESYAGKYVPAVAYTIHENNEKNVSRINLKGIAIGNGLSDPENMMLYSDYFYQIGLIDSNQRSVFSGLEEEIVESIRQKNFTRATYIFQELILGAFVKDGTYFHNYTGFSFIYNILHDKIYSPYGDINKHIQSNQMRRILHVGDLEFHADLKVEKLLYDDIMKSIKPWMEVLIEKYRVLSYNGQLDLIVPYPCTLGFLHSLKWSGADTYKNSPRRKWVVGSDLAGYWKTAKGLTEVLVRNAGHMVPADQPVWAFDLITRFVFNKSF